jgi:hypothetical protein
MAIFISNSIRLTRIHAVAAALTTQRRRAK